MNRKKITFVLFILLFLTSCNGKVKNGSLRLQNQGLVLMTDDSYKASIFGSNASMAFASPEGLLWHKGKLYLADEGGVALEVWSKADGLKTLIDSSFGTESPEDLVIDNDGNIFFSDDDAGGLWEYDAHGSPRLVAGKDKGLISTEGIALN